MTTPAPSWVATARIALLQPLVLLLVAMVSWPADWERLHAVLDNARSPDLDPAERDAHATRYYEGLIRGNNHPDATRGALSLRMIGRPTGWVRFQEADVVEYLEDDFLEFQLKPSVRRTLFGQPFETNAFGMHGDPVSLEKPEGTFRIAVLGASIDMGWGVKHQDTYINQFQEWLGAHAARHGLPASRRFEVLNFAVMAYSPLQRLDSLRRKAMAFRPDLVIYSATTLDVRLTEIHLRDMLRKGVDLKYDFVRDAIAEAGIVRGDLRVDAYGELINKARLKAKLRPLYWGLYDATLGAIAGECRAADVPLVMVIIPRVGEAGETEARAEPVARLKAIAAHHALPVYDLSDTFDGARPSSLEIAAWDDHPNAKGHHRLFLALARAIVKDSEVYQQLFPTGRSPEPTSLPGPEPPQIREARAGPEPAGEEGPDSRRNRSMQ